MKHRLRRAATIPIPLTVLLALAALQSVAWVILIPPLQGPDELGHFAYTQKLVESRTIPWYPAGYSAVGGEDVSNEAGTFIGWAGVNELRANLAARPPGSVVAVRLWRERDRALAPTAKSDGGYTSAMANPPLYYLSAALPYTATKGMELPAREMAMRLWNIPLLLAVVAFTWLIAGALLGRRDLQVLATAAVALQPQLIHLSAVVNPDLQLAAIWTAFFWAAIGTLRHGVSRGRVALLVALALVSGLTHARGVAIAVPLALTLALAMWRHDRPGWGRRGWAAAAIALGTLVMITAYASLRYTTGGAVTTVNVRRFVSYLWQFYLPPLSWMQAPPGPDYGVRQVFVDRFFAFYAQLEVAFSPQTLDLLATLSRAAVVLAIVGLLTRYRGGLRQRWDVLAVIAIAAAAYLFQQHLAAFKALTSSEPDPVLTGRYLLPFVAFYGIGLALATAWLPRRIGALAAGTLVGALGLLQVGAIGLVLERFYA